MQVPMLVSEHFTMLDQAVSERCVTSCVGNGTELTLQSAESLPLITLPPTDVFHPHDLHIGDGSVP